MKKLILSAVLAATSLTTYAQVGVGTITPNASAELDITSTTSGLLPPRMTETQRNAIATPAAGLMLYCTDCGANGEPQFYNGASWLNMAGGAAAAGPITILFNGLTYQEVTSSTTRIWLDRNLGASQVATSSTDHLAHGSLYQWGRLTDGHEMRSSLPTDTLSTGDIPGNNRFIRVPPPLLDDDTYEIPSDLDWRSPKNDDLWQGITGTNNPCPTGFRLPTETELNAERLSWSSNNSGGAFASVLKLTLAGIRVDNSVIINVGVQGHYWSSTVSGYEARYLHFGTGTGFAFVSPRSRATGFSVRCIKNL